MKYLSVCSGIEAATCAWHILGWEPVGFSEIEPFPCAVLAHRFPGVKNFGDMTKYKEWKDVGQFDLLVGGTPCQSFSVAGLRKGLNDPRGNLMLVYGAIADYFRPTWIVWENVPGVLSSNGGKDFGSFLGMLGELGYGVAYRVLDAQYFGVAQRRRRVFVVGYLGDWRRAAQILFESESLSGNNPPSREKGKEIAKCLTRGVSQRFDAETETMIAVGGIDASEDGTGRGTPLVPVGSFALRGREGGAMPEYEGNKTGALRASAGGSSRSYVYDMRGRGDGNTIGREPENGGNGIGCQEDVSYTLTKTDQHGVCVPKAFAQNTRDEVREMNVVGALAAQPGMKQTSYIRQESTVRRLTPRECERLQGFPDDWTKIPWRGASAENCPDGPRYKACGNSMAVPVMRWIGKRMLAGHSAG